MEDICNIFNNEINFKKEGKIIDSNLRILQEGITVVIAAS